MYNALCCSIFTPDLDVSGGVPGAKSGTAQAVPVVSPPTPLSGRVVTLRRTQLCIVIAHHFFAGDGGGGALAPALPPPPLP